MIDLSVSDSKFFKPLSHFISPFYIQPYCVHQTLYFSFNIRDMLAEALFRSEYVRLASYHYAYIKLSFKSLKLYFRKHVTFLCYTTVDISLLELLLLYFKL